MIKRAIGIQFNPWDQVYHFDPGDTHVAVGDGVIVRTDSGVEIGTVVHISEVDEGTLDASLAGIVRRATEEDVAKGRSQLQKRGEVLAKTRECIQKHKLDMKLVDCYFSYDGGKITFVFTADGRIDFRELVKDLARQFQKSIRLQQIGIRDEARRMGGLGPCGRVVCCKQFLKNLSSVTTDLARVQQVHSRGSDRISGACGRLMCCLSYEAEFYQTESKRFPSPGTKVSTKNAKGTVSSFNVIKETVIIATDGGIIEVPLKEVKRI